jgi:hypothetical protein
MQGASGLGDGRVVAGGAGIWRPAGSRPVVYAGLPGRVACPSAVLRSFQRSSMCSQPTLRRRSRGVRVLGRGACCAARWCFPRRPGWADAARHPRRPAYGATGGRQVQVRRPQPCRAPPARHRPSRAPRPRARHWGPRPSNGGASPRSATGRPAATDHDVTRPWRRCGAAVGAGRGGDGVGPAGLRLPVHLISAVGPARTARLRLSMGSTDLPGIRGTRSKDFPAGAELRIDPDMTRATLPDSPTRRTGPYVRIRARADAVYLAFRFGRETVDFEAELTTAATAGT